MAISWKSLRIDSATPDTESTTARSYPIQTATFRTRSSPSNSIK